MITFSIVMPYFNRKDQLRLTLERYASSPLAASCEVILVDDGSSAEHRLDASFVDAFAPLSFRLYYLPRDRRTWVNPCIPCNFGLTKARGEWIILQSPEVYPYTSGTPDDLLTYLSGANRALYHVMEVFALPPPMDAATMRTRFAKGDHAQAIVGSSLKHRVPGEWHTVWYTHRRHKPNFLHFCAAMHRSVLDQVGGFNPAMAHGIDYDDNEFVERVKRVAKPVYIPSPFVGFHLWHPRFNYMVEESIQTAQREANKQIFIETVRTPSLIHVDISQHQPECVEELSSSIMSSLPSPSTTRGSSATDSGVSTVPLDANDANDAIDANDATGDR